MKNVVKAADGVSFCKSGMSLVWITKRNAAIALVTVLDGKSPPWAGLAKQLLWMI